MLDKFISTPIREKAGAVTSGRFDYQKDWSICQLLETHNKQSDYLFIFDYHDDLVIMDSEANPQKVSFYQVKGKKGSKWSLNELLKSSKTNDDSYLLSIIGKLYAHKINFSDKIESVNFISNAPFSVGLESGTTSIGKDVICIVELSKKEKKKLHEKLRGEYHLSADDVDFESISFLKMVELSLDDSATHTTGKLANFLHNRNPQKKFNVPLIYKVLFDEVKRRTAYSKEITDYTGLLENKSLSRTKFNTILDRIGVNKDYDEIWQNVQTALGNEGIAYADILAYKKQWEKLQMERMTYNNDLLYNLLDRIKDVVQKKEAYGSLNGLSLLAMVEDIYDSLSGKNETSLYEEQFIKAAIISEIHD